MIEKILMVDDDTNILNAYRRNLRSKFKITTAEGSIEALKKFKEEGPFSIVVSDYNMPVMNGIEFLAKIRELAPDSIRIMITGFANLQMAIDAVNEGNIFRFLTKPSSIETITKALYAGLKQYQLVTAEKELLDKTLKGTIKVLIDILAVVNPSAFSKASRLKDLSTAVARRLGNKKKWEIEIATLLSQIGCIAVPAEIIEKINQGESLSDNEKEIFLSHPQVGNELLENIPRFDKVKEAIKYQFYRYDGDNDSEDYKAGDSIPLIARVLKVVNDYDEKFRKLKDNNKAFEELKKDEGAYDPDALLALEAELAGVSEEFVLQSVLLKDLKDGMILAENVVDERGTLLISKDSKITNVTMHRLWNYAKFNPVKEPLKVLIKKQ